MKKNTSAYVLEDDVPEEVKQARVEEIMELQSQISWEKIKKKMENLRCIFDRKKEIISWEEQNMILQM